MKITLLLILFHSYTWASGECLTDVKEQFENLSPHGDDISIKVKKGVFIDKSYTSRALNNLGIDNHFQGIQKLPGLNNFVITGSDINEKSGDLIVINNGEIVRRLTLDNWPYWHPGGIQVQDNILAVPVEEYKKSEISKIYFYDLADVTYPTKLPVLVDIPRTKSGAVLFYRFPNRQYLIGSYNMNIVDFYFSKSANLLDGFENKPRFSLDKKKFDFGGKPPINFGAQSVNLIPQCDGKLFIVFFENTGKLNPAFSRDDRALLFSLDFNAKGNPVLFVSIKGFTCGKRCNFAAATGTYINQGKLFIYSSPHYLSFRQNLYNIREFKEKKRP